MNHLLQNEENGTRWEIKAEPQRTGTLHSAGNFEKRSTKNKKIYIISAIIDYCSEPF